MPPVVKQQGDDVFWALIETQKTRIVLCIDEDVMRLMGSIDEDVMCTDPLDRAPFRVTLCS